MKQNWALFGDFSLNNHSRKRNGKMLVLKSQITVLTATAVLMAALLLGSCSNPAAQKPEVTGIKILLNGRAVVSPLEAMQGDTLRFSAEVQVKGKASKNVQWTVSGSKPASGDRSSINKTSGTLNISVNETANIILTVTAISTEDFTKYAQAKIQILPKEPNNPAEEISISTAGGVTEIAPGGSLQFFADADADSNAPSLVWSISSGGHSGSTVIDPDSGLLTVSAGETARTLIIRASSTDDAEVYGEIAITVTAVNGRFAISYSRPFPNGNITGPANAVANSQVTLTLIPNGNSTLQSLTVTRTGGTGTVAVNGSGNSRMFIMPAYDVTINAAFVAPTFNISYSKLYPYGNISGPANAAAGSTVTLLLIPYSLNGTLQSLTVTETGGTGTATVNGSGNSRAFTMPAYNVTINAEFARPDGATPPDISGRRSVKRGACYSFALNGEDNEDITHTIADMNLLAPGITWFYTWGQDPSTGIFEANNLANGRMIAREAAARGIEFYPMAWNTYWDPARIGDYVHGGANYEGVAYHPRYLLAYNEPALSDQANTTPANLREDWQILKTFAAENGMKLISPAMQYGNVGPGDPVDWMNEFFNGEGGVTLDDIDGVAIHAYMGGYPGTLKGYLERFYQYNKPIWMTEFNGDFYNPYGQRYFMSQTCMFMEQDPRVEKYSWFMPKVGDSWSMHGIQLLNNTNPVTLTDLGLVYVHMSICDETYWAPAGDYMQAKDFTRNNITEHIGKTTWGDSVDFRPSTDPQKISVLDIDGFGVDMWVEYQIEVPETRNYDLSIRYYADLAAQMHVSIDGETELSLSVPGSWNWNTFQNSLNISAGRHTLRIRVQSGNIALNWLRLE